MALLFGRRNDRDVDDRIDKLEARDERSREQAGHALRRAYVLMDERMKKTHRQQW